MTENLDTQLGDFELNMVEFSVERIDGIHEYGANESPESYSIEDGNNELFIGELNEKLCLLISTSDKKEEISTSVLIPPEQVSEFIRVIQNLPNVDSQPNKKTN
jgi:hypothetical protein